MTPCTRELDVLLDGLGEVCLQLTYCKGTTHTSSNLYFQVNFRNMAVFAQDMPLQQFFPIKDTLHCKLVHPNKCIVLFQTKWSKFENQKTFS